MNRYARAAILAVVLAAGCATSTPTADKAADKVDAIVDEALAETTTTAPATTTTRRATTTTVDPMVEWGTNHSEDMAALGAIMGDVSATAGRGDSSGLAVACQRFGAQVAATQVSSLPVPDPVVNEHLSAALDLFAEAAVECVTDAATLDPDALFRSSDLLKQGTAELTKATDALDG